MIIQLRGTSGSGKTTIMRGVMETIHFWQARFVSGRKQPLYYECAAEEWGRILLLGHYESPSGGCDNIGSAKEIWAVVERLRQDYPTHHLLCESLLLSGDVKWTMTRPGESTCLFLTTSLPDCLANIKKRRAAAGREGEFNEQKVADRMREFESARVRLIQQGQACFRVSPRQASETILRLVRRAGS